MKRFREILLGVILFTFLYFLGVILQFVPPDLSWLVILLYGLCLLGGNFFMNYSSFKTVAPSDFVFSALIFSVLALLLYGHYSIEDMAYVALITAVSTISYGCNVRFTENIGTIAQKQH